MTSITSFSLSFCLLILATSCTSRVNKAETATHVVEIDDSGLRELIHASEKPYVLVNVFTTQCKPSQREIPDLAIFNKNQEGIVEVLFVSIDNGNSLTDKLSAFFEKCGVNVRYFHFNPDKLGDFMQKTYPKWDKSTPTNLLFTREGRLVEVTGMTDRKEVRMIIHKDQSFNQ